MPTQDETIKREIGEILKLNIKSKRPLIFQDSQNRKYTILISKHHKAPPAYDYELFFVTSLEKITHNDFLILASKKNGLIFQIPISMLKNIKSYIKAPNGSHYIQIWMKNKECTLYIPKNKNINLNQYLIQSQTPTPQREYINQLKDTNEIDEFNEDDEAIYSAPEGRKKLRIHQRLEKQRNSKLPKEKKKQVLNKTGKLECEGCEFDFHKNYGERGFGFIECHHTIPISNLTEETETTLDDLALLCANCHRMVHRKKEWLTIPRLKEIIADNRNK